MVTIVPIVGLILRLRRLMTGKDRIFRPVGNLYRLCRWN